MIDQDIPLDITEFLADLRRQEVAPKTVSSYATDLRAVARWFTATTGEAFAAAAVTPTDLRDYRAHLRTVERRAPATVNRRLAALRRFFTWAKATGRVRDVPTEGVKGIPSTPRTPKSLAKRDLDRLLRAAEQDGDKRNLAILLTLRHTGLRVAELCNLHLADLAISERKGSVMVRSGKGNKDRVVPLNNDVRQALSAYLAVRPAIADDRVFIGQRGEPLQTDAVQLIVRKYARRAGLAGVTPHILRHSFGKGLLDAGTDLVTVSRLLGHERLETTAIYTQPTAQDLEAAVARLERDADRA
jgi:site-specific recombinase XerD